MKRLLLLSAAFAAVAIVPSPVELDAQGQGLAIGRPEWVPAVRHDTSRPLREIPGRPPASTRDDFTVKQAPFAPPQSTGSDPAVQQFAVAPLSATPGFTFEGIGENSPTGYNVNYAPPDTVGEAGKTQYVQWVNPSFAVFDKETGSRIYGPVAGSTIWDGFGGECDNRNDGDPIVQYDQLADRWVMTQFAVRSGNYRQCVAISQTEDATGAWHRYEFTYDDFPDYPKLSVWPDAYYITFNMFRNGRFFSGGRVCAYDRAQMLNGGPASQICYQLPNNPSLLPADLDGKTLPPAGTPAYVVNRGSNSLNVFRFRPNFANPLASSFSGPEAVNVASFTTACAQNCIPQPSTSQKLDALGDRLMYRLSYRNLGARQSMLVNHSVVTGSRTGVRWYELDMTNDSPSVRQQGTYAPDSDHRWMGSIAMDQAGNIAVGYSVSSSSTRPSIRFAGRDLDDPLGMLSFETEMQTGVGSQLPTLSRWGDYSAMTIDPVDDCTFWYTSEYLQVSGTFNWNTRVGTFKFTDCGSTEPPPPPDPSFSLAVDPSIRTVTQGGSTTFTATVTALNGYSGTGTWSVSGLPAGVSDSFSEATFTGGDSTVLTLNVSESAQPGSFPIQITADDGTLSQTATVTLTIEQVQQADFSVSVSPSNRTVKRGNAGSYTVSVVGSGGFAGTVSFTVTGGPTAGTTYTFSPTTVTGGGSTTLTVQTTSSTPRGVYSLIVTGTDGSATRSATVTLRVN